MSQAGFNRGGSRQDYETPPDFITAVVKRFGPIAFDLAASAENAKAKRLFRKEDDALAQCWHAPDIRGLLWLNPPYANIAPWAKKCAEEAEQGAKILFLVPASVGSNWFQNHVFNQALVLFLNGRIKFVGAKDAYPKDCLLACYNHDIVPDCEIWNWNK